MADVKRETAKEKKLKARDLGHYLGCKVQYGYRDFIGNGTLSSVYVYKKTVRINRDHAAGVVAVVIEDVSPILRPLSDLTQNEMEDYWNEELLNKIMAPAAISPQAKFMIDRYFDVFGWIDAGLAIDATTLSSNPYDSIL